MPFEDDISDEGLTKAVRRRLLSELQAKSDAHQIVNNMYGGDVGGGHGIREGMGGETDPRELDYFVDILKKNIDPQNPQMGWQKSVHRFSKKKATP